MLRILPILLVIFSLVLTPAQAQQASSSSSRRVVAKATPVPVATPVPKKRSFFERLFGRRPRATPAPATPAPATPKPRKARSTSTRPSVKATAPAKAKTSGTSTKPEAAVERPRATTEQPAPASETPEPKPAPKPAAKKTPSKPAATTTSKTTPPPPPNTTDPEELDKHKYDVAKSKAMDDPEIQALKQKADEAVTDEEANKAQRAYNKALFARMRKLDPLIKERIDRMEAAMMKRLGDQPGAR